MPSRPATARPAPAAIAPLPDILLTERRGAIAILTLNRSAARNSLSEALIADLHRAVQKLSADASTRAIVIAAAGPSFCAGHDLKELTAHRTDPDRGRAYFAKMMTACSNMMQSIVHSPKPIIAAVQGVATAAGCQLVASCDLAIAAETASFATPGVDIGLFCSTPMVALSRNVPRKHAIHMLMTGEPVSAARAREIGLVNDVVKPGGEREAAIALADRIATKSALTLKIGKEAFYRQAEMTLREAYHYAAEVMTMNMLAHDAEEGINAFIEKRDPKWEDR
jgi:enoyl-CoA hydratase/carnithine racemase